uniref:Bowman-Birk serine protease inhibitors family domain-containing protein n=1 Tax=Oryza brachyantha TaxID=4533 RepID=J3L1Q6_ORYBR
MKNNTRMLAFMLLLTLGSLAVVAVHGGRTHAMEALSLGGEDKAAAAPIQPEIDPITICSPSNFCVPEAWSSCYRCIVKPYDNPPFLTLDDCKRSCPIPPTTMSPAHA